MGKVIITGPGRAGTSFLMRLLTRLGKDTGFTAEKDGYSEDVRAGCEHQVVVQVLKDELAKVNLEGAPRILKSPDWAFVLKNMVRSGLLEVDHVFIPFRDLDVSARSRLDAGLNWMCPSYVSAEEEEAYQADIHGLALGRTLEACWICGIPHTVMMFPHLVQDVDYCYDRLSRGLTLEKERFRVEFEKLAKPEQVKWR